MGGGQEEERKDNETPAKAEFQTRPAKPTSTSDQHLPLNHRRQPPGVEETRQRWIGSTGRWPFGNQMVSPMPYVPATPQQQQQRPIDPAELTPRTTITRKI